MFNLSPIYSACKSSNHKSTASCVRGTHGRISINIYQGNVYARLCVIQHRQVCYLTCTVRDLTCTPRVWSNSKTRRRTNHPENKGEEVRAAVKPAIELSTVDFFGLIRRPDAEPVTLRLGVGCGVKIT